MNSITAVDFRAARWSNAQAMGLFVLIQVGVMLVAISSQSLWIDEFWTAYFTTLKSSRELYDLLLIPNGSQTPLHFAYYYFWGLWFEPTEWALRLANLPLFLAGQLALYWSLRTFPRKFSYLFLAICSLQPLVWQYANEARPYIMMYAGSEMILAYIINLHVIEGRQSGVDPIFSMIFIFGAIFLFGASLLGVFWVFSACLYIIYFHNKNLAWHYLFKGWNPILICILLMVLVSLSGYYLNSLMHGAGASRLSSTTITSALFGAYELLGLSGLGPNRLQMRDTGLLALIPYLIWLIPAGGIILTVLWRGLREAAALTSRREFLFDGFLIALPIAVVIFSGFAMHWRVLGRHLIASLPILNLILAVGLSKSFGTGSRRGVRLNLILGAATFAVLVGSGVSLRFAARHQKDDYRGAADIAQQGISQGRRVWWAADAVGASYYHLPGEFDFMGEITGSHQPEVCTDRPGVQSVANASGECLKTLSAPDIVIVSKPETFDTTGGIADYLQRRNYSKAQELQAFAVWTRGVGAGHSHE